MEIWKLIRNSNAPIRAKDFGQVMILMPLDIGHQIRNMIFIQFFFSLYVLSYTLKTILMRKIAILLLAFCLFHSLSIAQELKDGASTTWNASSAGGMAFGVTPDNFYREHIIYVSESEAVFRFSEKDAQGIVKVNNKGQVKWKAPMIGRIVGMSLLNKNILVLSVPLSKDRSARNLVTTVQATILDPASGKKIMEKDIPINAASTYAEVGVHNNDAGEFQQMFVRHTKWDGDKILSDSKFSRVFSQTSLIELFAINKDLGIEPKASFPIANDDQLYVQSALDKNGRMDVLWLTASSLFVEQYVPGTSQPVVKVSTPFQYNDKWNCTVIFAINNSNPDQVALAMRYHNNSDEYIKAVQVDLSAKKAYVYDEPLTNDYRKTLEPKTEAPDGWSKGVAKKTFYDMEVSDLHFYGNNLVLVREARGHYDGNLQYAVHFFTGDLLVSVFNQNGTIIKHFVLSKHAERFQDVGMSLGSSVSGDKLQFVALHDAGTFAYKYVYGSINLKDMKWDKVDFMKQGGEVLKAGLPLDASKTVWFPNSAVLFFQDHVSFGSVAMQSQLKVLTP